MNTYSLASLARSTSRRRRPRGRTWLALIGLLLVCAAVGIVLMIQSTAAAPPAPAGTAPAAIAPAATPLTPPSQAAPAEATTSITLRRGDTLWSVARRHHTTVADLQSLNQLGTSTLIRAGRQLRVPADAAPATQLPPARTAVTTRTHPAVSHRSTRPASATPTSGEATARQTAATLFGREYDCAANIITRESGWNAHATNPRSGAYGLAQALPGSKMARSGANWHDDAATQLTWMREYVTTRYGGACPAWTFWQAHHWY